ncbi:unnamed protein product [Mytilus coruscus]|uniref:Uncharacterized protein n=1 Tax=Mytilus coruscus TaxID=42192 RepID=A0A6J8DUU2_MYTCO|nr:unnamed protein product [Mytilus coruscus]
MTTIDNKANEAETAANRGEMSEDKNGAKIIIEYEQLKQWAEHFNEVLNQPEPVEKPSVDEPIGKPFDIELRPPNKEEISKAITDNKLKNNKSPGIDIIESEMLKTDTKFAKEQLHKLFTKIRTEEIPTLLEAVEKKKTTLATIDEQILNTVDSEDITDEILETDEYYLELEGKHKVADCKSKNTCKFCHWKHHSSLCKKNSCSNKHPIEAEQPQNKVDTETSMFYTASEERSTVFIENRIQSSRSTKYMYRCKIGI